jgi:hypothetical protein
MQGKRAEVARPRCSSAARHPQRRGSHALGQAAEEADHPSAPEQGEARSAEVCIARATV